jgi:uncharacterized protein (UPF0261 family)
MPKPVVVAGTLDTKGEDLRFVRDLIRARGLETVVVDFGVMGDPPFEPDIPAREVALSGGADLEELRNSRDKARAMQVMAAGLSVVVKRLHDSDRLGGIVGLAGGGGTAIVTAAMRGLPLGLPKVMCSTVAGGDTSAYTGTSDIAMFPAIVDVAGLNSISRRIYSNAAAAVAGMVEQPAPPVAGSRPLITASMFGNSTACVTRAKVALERNGYEVLVFHATGTGGRTMESLLAGGFIAGNLDLTTTELADLVCGGVLSAGPERLGAAAQSGVPTVLAPGCVDMCNFWAPDSVPELYRSRLLYPWNPNVTLMRTNPQENQAIGRRIAQAANAAVGPIAVLLPLGGLSQLDSPGNPFWDQEADAACFDAIRAGVRHDITLFELDHNINDPAFADFAASTLLGMLA